MENSTKLVDFHTWCSKCEHFNLKENESPCNECLMYGGRDDGSRKPIYFKEKYYEDDKNKR